jgi:hypothetical protein
MLSFDSSHDASLSISNQGVSVGETDTFSSIFSQQGVVSSNLFHVFFIHIVLSGETISTSTQISRVVPHSHSATFSNLLIKSHSDTKETIASGHLSLQSLHSQHHQQGRIIFCFYI